MPAPSWSTTLRVLLLASSALVVVLVIVIVVLVALVTLVVAAILLVWVAGIGIVVAPGRSVSVTAISCAVGGLTIHHSSPHHLGDVPAGRVGCSHIDHGSLAGHPGSRRRCHAADGRSHHHSGLEDGPTW